MNTRNTILIADDMEVNRAILSEMFSSEYRILEAEDGMEALELLERESMTIAVVLLDIVMPRMDGYELLREMNRRGMLAQIPAVMVTSEYTTESEVRAFDLGVSDIILKPFEPHVVKRRVRNVIDLYRHKNHLETLVEEQAYSLQASNEAMLDALSSVIEYRSLESGQHIRRIRMFTKILLEDVARAYPEYGIDEQQINIIASASSMHDIGKIAIPDSILNKPGRLTAEEFEIMKTHTTKGCEMLESIGWMENREYLQFAYNICRYHHERWDGRGYPDGLKGDNIPACAQVAGIADVYDALTTDRVYKAAYPHEKAVAMILGGECGVFSPKLLDCFRNVQERFASLSREFADGKRPLQSDSFVRETSRLTAHDGERDTMQLGQLKYFTLLKYLQATVLEVDLDAGIYHMVYSPNADFDRLRGGNLFEEAYQSFVRGPVHPDDREMLDSCMSGSLKELFETGEAGHFWEFRVKSSRSGTYCWYRSTLLRVNTENPRQHRALIVFENIDGEHTAYGKLNPDEQQMILGLRGICALVLTCNLADDTCARARQDGIERTAGFAETIRLLAQAVYPEDRGRFLESLAPETLWRCLEAATVRMLEFRQLDASGKYRWMELCCVRTGELSADSRPVAFFEWDIHDRKLAQQEGGRSLARLETVLRRSYEATMEFDLQNRRYKLLYQSDQMPQISPEGEIGELLRQVRESLHPEDYIKLENNYGVNYLNNAFRAGTRQISYEFRLCNGAGWQWYEASVVCGEDGCWRDMSMMILVRKIAERLSPAVQAAQGESCEPGLARLLREAPGGAAMILLDDELTVLQGTDGYYSLLGYTREEFNRAPVQGKALRVICMEEKIDVARELRRIIQQDPVCHFEFQVRRKDGGIVRLGADARRVILEDGALALCGLFSYAARVCNLARENAADSPLLLQLIQALGDVLIDYNLRTGALKFSESFQKKFGVQPPATLEKLAEFASARIHEDDLGHYNDALSQVPRMEEQETVETAFRYLGEDGSYRWCRERVCLLRDRDGSPCRAIGIISDIDRYKLQGDLMETRATTDQLTGLYNRSATETLIGEALSGEQPQALFVVDIDDFKIVNDSCGHLTGDQVLRKIANKILAQFRRDDLVGRIGGDEFVVLLRNVPDQELISKKAASLLSALGELFADLDRRRYITASIGVAVYPKDGTSYEELFQKADAALYASKHWGKEQWRMYSDDLAVVQPAMEHPLKPARIEGACATADVNSFISQAAGILYTMEDTEAIKALLDMAAREYALNHIHVDETEGVGRRLFEWNANSAVSFRSSAWAVSPDAAQAFREINASSEPFICDDTGEAPEPLRSEFLRQGIRAWLQVPVRENGKTYAVVGFSESEPRQWTAKEVEICQFLARSVALGYLKKQLAAQLEQVQQVNDLLFNQAELESYVVDGGYSVQKANRKLSDLMEIPCGEKCYAVLRGRRGPCEECPVKQLSRSQGKASVDGIYVEALGVYCGVTATNIKRVNSNDAYLITLDRQAAEPLPPAKEQKPGN